MRARWWHHQLGAVRLLFFGERPSAAAGWSGAAEQSGGWGREQVDGGVSNSLYGHSSFLWGFFGGNMSRVSWQRRLEEEEVLEEVLRRSEWKVFTHRWEEEEEEEEEEDAEFTVESISVWFSKALLACWWWQRRWASQLLTPLKKLWGDFQLRFCLRWFSVTPQELLGHCFYCVVTSCHTHTESPQVLIVSPRYDLLETKPLVLVVACLVRRVATSENIQRT